MLEGKDWDEKADRLLGHFRELSEAHDSLLRGATAGGIACAGGTHGKYREVAQHAERIQKLVRAADAFF